MSWFGKVLGGALGFALGGPIGALIGVALGHNIDRAARSGRGQGWTGLDFLDDSDAPDDFDTADALDPRERTQTAFFTATFSVMGHLAKADGTVTRDEIRLASRVMDEMQLSGAHRQLAQVE